MDKSTRYRKATVNSYKYFKVHAKLAALFLLVCCSLYFIASITDVFKKNVEQPRYLRVKLRPDEGMGCVIRLDLPVTRQWCSQHWLNFSKGTHIVKLRRNILRTDYSECITGTLYW